MGKKLTKAEAYALANRLLTDSGFGYDGSLKKNFSPQQKFFERKTVIITPMGNGSR